MNSKLDLLQEYLRSELGEKIQSLDFQNQELTLTVLPSDYLHVSSLLRDKPSLRFEQLVDLCGVDYSTYKDGSASRYSSLPRYCVVSHLLSIQNNWRLRLKVFAVDQDFPSVPSLTDIWNSVGWFEREAFDLFGIMFEGHVDLRRILTDYGFVGHPFRKDFPTTGHVEMRYDTERKRVIYQPVSIETREITPRIIREESYGGLH